MVANKVLAKTTPFETDIRAGFHPARIVAPILIALVGIGLLSRWYAQENLLPRYCADPRSTLELLDHVISEERPAGNNSRVPYLIAAKLLFLLPQKHGESVREYLDRIELHLRDQCQ